jgi:cytochrome-b5 reductase
MATFPTSIDGFLEHPEMIVVALITVAAIVLSSLYLFKLLVPGGPPKVLPIAEFANFTLMKKTILSHDTRAFTFALPPNHVLGLATGQHVTLKYEDEVTGKAVQRSYTPVTDDRTVGSFSLVIKVYKPLEPRFPEGGKMSQHMDNLNIGDSMLVKGPKGHVHYHSPGKFTVKPLGKPLEDRTVQQIGIMAGGTGITPMLQVLNAIFHNAADSKTQVKMIYANNTPSDILVREEIEKLASEFSDRFQVWYTVGNSDEEKDWKYDTGFINPEMVAKHLMFDDKAADTQFFMCGPRKYYIAHVYLCIVSDRNCTVLRFRQQTNHDSLQFLLSIHNRSSHDQVCLCAGLGSGGIYGKELCHFLNNI